MEATFKLGFTEDFSTSILWVETGDTAIIPAGYPLWSPEDIKNAAIACFPMYGLKLQTYARKLKEKEEWRERYYKKLVPEVEKFKFPSYSEPGVFHTITVIDRGRGRNIHCSCWPYVRTKRRCDHIYGWLELKEHPVAEELAVYRGPSKHKMPSLWQVMNRTLLSMDTNESTAKSFVRSVRNKLQWEDRKASKSGSMTNANLPTAVGNGSTAH